MHQRDSRPPCERFHMVGSLGKAKRKIRHIAEFCGYDGCREQPGYMAQLAAEYIREAAFSAWTIKRRAAKN